METVWFKRSLVTVVGLLLVFTVRVKGQVKIKSPTDQVTAVNDGGQQTFLCQSTADGVVEWLFNGAVIDVTSPDVNESGHHNRIQSNLATAEYTVKRVQTGSTVLNYLTITRVNVQHSGLYTCRQIYADDVTLNVIPWRELHITEPAENVIEVEAGENFTMSCVGAYNSTIVWYWKGRPITEPTTTYGQVQQNTTVVRLFTPVLQSDPEQNWRSSTISRVLVQPDMAGPYQCRDSSKLLEPSRNVTLKVIGHHPNDNASHKDTGSGQSSIITGLQLPWLVVTIATAFVTVDFLAHGLFINL